eukprot:gene9610-1832_t
MRLLVTILASVQFAIALNGKRVKLFRDANGTTHLLSPNEAHPFTVNSIDVIQTMRIMTECFHAACESGYYRSDCEQLLTMGNCLPCPLCPDGYYRSNCGGLSEGFCETISRCGHNEYEIRAPTTTSDRLCGLPLCAVNEYETHRPTPTTNRRCASLSQCNSSELEIISPTPTTDRECAPFVCLALSPRNQHRVLKNVMTIPNLLS